ncbi:transducin/WD40 repeat-like superfamily protein isoform X1 [Wolffia australiana]
MEVAPDVEAEAEESSMSSSEQGRESSIDGDGKSEALAADEEHDVNRQPFSWPEFRFDLPPRKIHHFHKQYRDKTRISGNNFLKGVKWSPDGSAFLTSSDDDSLRLFYLPEGGDGGGVAQAEADVDREDSFESNLIVWEGESVYDYCWYPFMSLQDMNSCVFASTCRDHPIHLWDAFSGQLRATYRAYDAMDEITAALSVSFNTFGTKIFAGYNKCIRIFDVHRPGRDFELHSTLKGNEGLSGIVSSIGFSPSHNGLLAFGSFNQTTAVYAEGNMELLFVLHGQEGGVTQVLFSKDGNYLYTGGRKEIRKIRSMRWERQTTEANYFKISHRSQILIFCAGIFEILLAWSTSCIGQLNPQTKEYPSTSSLVEDILALVARMVWFTFTTSKLGNGYLGFKLRMTRSTGSPSTRLFLWRLARLGSADSTPQKILRRLSISEGMKTVRPSGSSRDLPTSTTSIASHDTYLRSNHYNQNSLQFPLKYIYLEINPHWL